MSNDYIVLTRGDVIREGDEERPSDFGLRWYPVYASRVGSPVQSHPEYTFRRPRSTLILDAAIELLREGYREKHNLGKQAELAEKLREAIGISIKELRGDE